MIGCNTPTTHYDSGRALLLAYDQEGDGKIGAVDIGLAISRLHGGEITQEEYDFIVLASTEGTIDEFCPAQEPEPEPTETNRLWLLIGAVILLYILTQG